MHKIISPSGGGLFCLLALPILRAAIKRRLEKLLDRPETAFDLLSFTGKSRFQQFNQWH
jgi:hypothetical protein